MIIDKNCFSHKIYCQCVINTQCEIDIFCRGPKISPCGTPVVLFIPVVQILCELDVIDLNRLGVSFTKY